MRVIGHLSLLLKLASQISELFVTNSRFLRKDRKQNKKEILVSAIHGNHLHGKLTSQHRFSGMDRC